MTLGAALLFLWMAVIGERPAGWSYSGEPSRPIGAYERLAWALLGAGLISYEIWKLHNFAKHPFQ
ncbi:MAG TPA: hypothetical protein VNR64_07535 [Vicinamibacterales bacterium]|nr:hypothetical protein [Vicinamibacterales bacterium]